jgi:hypothetical protein
MNVHLKENGFVRSVFNLDDLEAEDGQKTKGNRFERVYLLKYIDVSFELKCSFCLAIGE